MTLPGDPFDSMYEPETTIGKTVKDYENEIHDILWPAEPTPSLDQIPGLREEQLRHNRLDQARTDAIMTSGREFERNRQRNCAEAEAAANRRINGLMQEMHSRHPPINLDLDRLPPIRVVDGWKDNSP